MADTYREKLRERALEIRRLATRREIEKDGYGCQPWFDDGADYSFAKVLTMERYLNGPPLADGEPNKSFNVDFYAPYGGEVWNHVYGELEWVDQAITKFGQSRPSALQHLIESVRDIPEYLMGDNAWRDESSMANLNWFDGGSPLAAKFGDDAMRGQILLESAMQELGYWTGATAQAYTRTFGANGEVWEEISQNNWALAEYLVRAAEAQLAVYLTTRESVVNICDATKEALWGVNETAVQGAKLSTVLSVFGAVIGLGLSVFSGGTATPFVSAAFAITGALVAKAEGESATVPTGASGPPAEVTGGTPMEVLLSMNDRFQEVETTASQKEDEIRDALRTAYNTVTHSSGTRSTFQITFAEGTPMDDMGNREVSMTTGDLVNVATKLFPQSADRVFSAHELLAASDDGDAFQAEWHAAPTTVQTAWTDLRDLLQDLTGANGDKIRYAGRFLLDYAVETGEVDKSGATTIEKSYDGYETTESGTEHEEYVPTPVLGA